ncbi:hypothetical protein BU25DRAFT_426424 [Macroventuria anomochaeta]|uniref:Uncharacterized protein n=1 Tax=Macroventuria anomochaeta TaxID=301207 RepID=A0ACB6RK37_9PLEO|nr:uncharacterized protein BU25DRAFT_426424 [Macroventuria anomochaeta]KAF2621524.1 hypothetical protein BU25DRAFT_426424 [Macroventuria anomochaeta]
MWFRLLVKAVSSHSGSSYKWHEMNFCFCWDLGRCSIHCVGVDPSFQSLLQDILRRMWSQLPPAEPRSLLVPLMEIIIVMYGRSVWSIRDITWRAEKANQSPHCIPDAHAPEPALAISVQQGAVIERDCACEKQSPSLTRSLMFYQSYNMIAQRDSQVMTGLGQAVRQDSGVMRTIAVVTMAILPPTVLSAGLGRKVIFSMSFFDYTLGQGSQSERWSVSEKFWVYWAFAIPLPCLTLGIWFWRQKQI